MMCSITPMNSLSAGGETIRCATRWLTVAAALRRPNGSTVGVLYVGCFGERGSPPVSRAMSFVSEKVRWR